MLIGRWQNVLLNHRSSTGSRAQHLPKWLFIQFFFHYLRDFVRANEPKPKIITHRAFVYFFFFISLIWINTLFLRIILCWARQHWLNARWLLFGWTMTLPMPMRIKCTVCLWREADNRLIYVGFRNPFINLQRFLFGHVLQYCCYLYMSMHTCVIIIIIIFI